MATGLGPALGIVFEADFQVYPQFCQGGLVAGLLGEGVIEGRQLAALEILQTDFKTGLAAGGLLLLVAVGEAALDGFFVTDGHADHALHEARDHAALLQFHLHGIAVATTDRLAAIEVGAVETDHRHIAAGGRPALHGHQGGQLLAGLVDQFVDAGGVVADRFGFGLEALGGLEGGGGLDVQFEGDGEGTAGLKARQDGLKPFTQLRPTERRQGLLLEGVATGRFHQVFQGGGADAQGADLLQQHRAGHLALAEAGQLDAAAELLHGGVVAGLAAVGGDGHLQGHPAARAGAGFDGQAGNWGGGRAHGKSMQGRILESGRSEPRRPIVREAQKKEIVRFSPSAGLGFDPSSSLCGSIPPPCMPRSGPLHVNPG